MPLRGTLSVALVYLTLVFSPIFLPSIFLPFPMPIECKIQLLPLTDAEFRRLDYRITERVFVRHATTAHFRNCSQTFS